MRMHGQSIINGMMNSWGWDSGCKSSFWTLSGIAYAFSNFGFVNFFLTGDALKKISKGGVSVRVSIKLLIEFMLFVVDLVIIYCVLIHDIFSECGTD